MRVSLRDDTAETKSASSRRNVGLPRALVELLRVHHDEQQSEREAAGQLWRDGGWLFATPTGDPVNPRTDYKDWKRLVSTAGLREGRLHDARHTAATVLLILGVPERAVMGLMGWSNTAMVTRYQHLTLPVLDGVADRVGELLWGGADEPIGTETRRNRWSGVRTAPVGEGPGFVGGDRGLRPLNRPSSPRESEQTRSPRGSSGRWRWDLNPRRLAPHTLSRRAP